MKIEIRVVVKWRNSNGMKAVQKLSKSRFYTAFFERMFKMSKIYDRYLQLKKEGDKYYLFRSGIFYIFVGEDAKKMSKILSLKCTVLTDEVMKCGFPISSLEKYLNLLEQKNIEVKIVDAIENGYSCVSNDKFLKYLDRIKKLDFNQITGIQALQLLEELKEIACGN